jgi:hypothetical protein
MHNLPAVECIGTVTQVQLWVVHTLGLPPFSSLGRNGGIVLGNDAVIVAQHLLGYGYVPRCQLLDPTNADLISINSVFDEDHIVRILGDANGGLTQSLCLETQSGQRSWIFSRYPIPRESLRDLTANWVYVDYYPELREYLDLELGRVVCGQQLYVNISSISAEIPRFPLKASVIQGSCSLSDADASALALQLLDDSTAERVVLTLGAEGAVMAMGNQVWHCVPQTTREESILGAGALFSSQMIIGLHQGRDGRALLDFAVRNTAGKLVEEAA